MTDDVDDFLADLGIGVGPEFKRKDQSPEEDFFDELTGHNGEKYAKIANIRYSLNHEMSQLQHMRESGVLLYVMDDAPVQASIPGAVAKPINSSKKIQRPLTNLEYLKIRVEYYLLMHHYPRFQHIESEPHRRTCSMSKVTDMIVEHDIIKELVNKRY